jgi:hypothetical protein
MEKGPWVVRRDAAQYAGLAAEVSACDKARPRFLVLTGYEEG